MKEKNYKVIAELEILEKSKKILQEEIAKLQIILSNLEAQKHSSAIKDEKDEQIKDNEQLNKYAAEERRIELKRIEAEKRIDTAENIEKQIASRMLEIEKQEARLFELENKGIELNKQRANFEIYKTGLEKQLEEAKITIAEANAQFEKIEIEKQSLHAREKNIKEKERYWNDVIGQLENDKREFQIEKENFLGLRKQEMEAVNVEN